MTSLLESKAEPERDAFGDDEIFYGSVPVYLSPVAGETLVYDDTYRYEQVGGDDGEAKTPITLTRKDPIPHPDGEAPVVVNCIPGLDVVTADPNHDTSSWPEKLRQPLIKVPGPIPGAPKAFASGVRSALVKIEGQWYRLKGSGNNDQGFIVKETKQALVQGGPQVLTRQIRGAAFMHTAKCENHVCARLAKHLEPEGVLGTNSAMGMYVYGGDDELPLGLSSPEFQTACIVQKTIGDRRFGTHVLAGITLLMESFLDVERLDEAALEAAFPACRKQFGDLGELGMAFIQEDDPVGIITTAGLFGRLQITCASKLLTRPAKGEAFASAWQKLKDLMAPFPSDGAQPSDADLRAMCEHIMDTRLVGPDSSICAAMENPISEGVLGSWVTGAYTGETDVAGSLWQLLQSWREAGAPEVPALPLPTIDPDMLVTPDHSLLQRAEQVPDSETLPNQFFRTEDGEGEKKADPRWLPAWKAACTGLLGGQILSENSGKSVLTYVFSRFGYECGRFARLLHSKCHMSWGTYQDAICHPSAWHCNAHSNNMVLMSPGADPEAYLSYLDLDMAFGASEFVDIDPKSKTFGVIGQSEEDFCGTRLAFENVNFMEVIAGNDSTTGVPPVASAVLNGFSRPVHLARTFLYDIMMHGYLHAYNGGDDRFHCEPYDKDLHEAGLCLIKLAVIKQADYIA